MAKQVKKSVGDVSRTPLDQFKGDVLALGFFKDTKKVPAAYEALDQAADGAIGRFLKLGDFTGEVNQVANLYMPAGLGFSRLLLVGLGDESKVTVNTLRFAAGSVARTAARLKVAGLGLALHGLVAEKFDSETLAQAMAEGAIYGNYNFQDYFTEEKNWTFLKLTLVAADADNLAALKKGWLNGAIIAEVQNYARSLSNKPGNEMNPPIFAKEAQRLAKELGIKCTVFDDKQLAAKKMNAILAVGSGSAAKPRLVVLEYNGRKGAKGAKSVKGAKGRPDAVIIGKGVTFDSGGLDIKPISSMQTMKNDKAGACNILAVMAAVVRLKLPIHVVALTPVVENMISGTSFRPDDIIKTYSGKTVEITSTDAEGRIILSDALTYGSEMKPKAMIDIATLTGGIVVALGSEYAGLFGNNDELLQSLSGVAKTSGEPVWIMPSGPEYLEQMRSKVADLKNTGGRQGAACTAAAFLNQFVVGDVPWAHIDIAALDTAEDEKSWRGVGATGYGVRMILSYLRSL
jgi:leucyl aminopeptidase